MNVPDDYIEQLKHEIANLRAMLEPLESGRIHTGTRRTGEGWTDTTAGWVDHLNKTIKMYQVVVDGRDDHHPRWRAHGSAGPPGA
jgi:hypothetical protein